MLAILDGVTNNQGILIDGPVESAFDRIPEDVIEMIQETQIGFAESPAGSSGSDAGGNALQTSPVG